LVDTEQGRIISDDEIKEQIATEKPYALWLRENLVTLDDLPDGPVVHEPITAPSCAASTALATPPRI